MGKDEVSVKKFWLSRAIKIAVFAMIAVGVLSFVVMSLWNALIPVVFGLKAISFWQALGLLVLHAVHVRPKARIFVCILELQCPLLIGRWHWQPRMHLAENLPLRIGVDPV